MASITIRNLDDDVKTRLRVRAASNGRSMEEEARLILRQAVGSKAAFRNLASAIRDRITPLGGVDLELPPRESHRPLIDAERSGFRRHRHRGRIPSGGSMSDTAKAYARFKIEVPLK